MTYILVCWKCGAPIIKNINLLNISKDYISIIFGDWINLLSVVGLPYLFLTYESNLNWFYTAWRIDSRFPGYGITKSKSFVYTINISYNNNNMIPLVYTDTPYSDKNFFLAYYICCSVGLSSVINPAALNL